MGPGITYLSEPIKTKESIDGQANDYVYGISSMQGWRFGMEDSHLAITKFANDPSSALFAVFDGHGGI